MTLPVPLYDTAYGNFTSEAVRQVRCETYGEDFGQSSWVTGAEYRRFFHLMELRAEDYVLDVGSGSGGPGLLMVREIGCRLLGVDINASGVKAGRELSRSAALQEKISFLEANLAEPLPFPDQMFSAIVCMDVLCHLPSRGRLFGEWARVLQPGGRLLCTDPVVVTGLVTRDEFAIRSSTGHFEFGPAGVNEKLLGEAGFERIRTEDVTASEAEVSGRWHAARERRAEELMRLEGTETFAGLQRFLDVVHRLTAERRMSRFAYLASKPAG